MFKNNLVCGSAIAIMLLTNLAPMTQIKADAAALSQAGSKAINTVYDTQDDEGDDSFAEMDDESDGTTEISADGSTYGKIERKIITRNPDISVSLNYGIDGYAVYDSGSQVVLNVHTVVEFSGRVVLMPDYDEVYSDSATMKYSQEIDWGADSDNTVKFYVNELGYGRLLVQIEDEDGQVVYAESDQPSVSGYEMATTVGVLSDDRDSFENLEDARVRTQSDSVSVRKLNMQTDLFPDSLQGLEVVHYILIDKYDTSKLSEDQMEALQEWVFEGGTLILSLGKDADRVLGGFDSKFINYELNGSSSKNVTVWSDKGSSTEYKKVSVADISVYGAQVNDALGGVSVLDTGYGRVVVVPYSLVSKPVAGGSGELQLMEMILKAGYTDKINNLVQGSFYDNSTGYGIINAINTNRKKVVSPYIFIVILVVYLILCGPVTYVVLKKLRRREWMWITVPAWALVGTIAIYIVSTRYSVTRPLELTFESADISDNIMRQNVYTYIIGSKADSYSVDVNSEYDNVQVMDEYYGDATYSQSMNIERCASDDGITMKFDTHIPFGGISLQASSVTTNDIGRFDSSLKLYTDGIEGSVKNNTAYDMRDVVVMTDGYYYCLDSLPAGESMDINKLQNRKMTNGLSIDCMKNYYIYRFGSGYNYDDEADVMMSRNYYMLLKMGAYSSVPSGMGRIAVWATIDKEADISDGQSSEKYGNYVVYDIHPQDYEDLDGAYYSNIYTRDVNRFEQSDYDTDDLMMYSDQVDIDICFQNDDNITTVTRESSTKDESTANVIVKAYNFYTDNYDVIFVNGSQEIEGDRLAPYIENNEMRLRCISPHKGEDYTETYLPRISARGGGQ